MRKAMYWIGLALLVVSFSVGAAERAAALSIDFYNSPLNLGAPGGGVQALAPGTTGAFVANVWGNPSEFVFAGFPIQLATTGGMTITAMACPSGAFGCQSNIVTKQFGFDESSNGFPAGTLIKMLTVTLNITGPGTLDVSGGTAVDEGFGSPAIDPDGILTLAAIPEPGTLLLLGSGLAGLVIQGRRREN